MTKKSRRSFSISTLLRPGCVPFAVKSAGITSARSKLLISMEPANAFLLEIVNRASGELPTGVFEICAALVGRPSVVTRGVSSNNYPYPNTVIQPFAGYERPLYHLPKDTHWHSGGLSSIHLEPRTKSLHHA